MLETYVGQRIPMTTANTHAFLYAGTIFRKFRAVKRTTEMIQFLFGIPIQCILRFLQAFSSHISSYRPLSVASNYCHSPRSALPNDFFSSNSLRYYLLLDSFTTYFTFCLRLFGFTCSMNEKWRILLFSHLLNSFLFC